MVRKGVTAGARRLDGERGGARRRDGERREGARRRMVMACVEMEVVMAIVAPGMLTTLVMLGAARCSAAPLLRCSAAALLRRSAAAL